MRILSHIATPSLALMLALVGMLLFSPAAFADPVDNGDEPAVVADEPLNFSCNEGQAVGELYVADMVCPTTLNMSNIFSFLVCNMEELSGNLMGHMYCGMVHSMTPVVWSAATLAVAIFGVAFTIGVIPMTGRDAIMFLLKIVFITGFATNADLLIGIVYTFLISGMREGIEIILAGLGGEYHTMGGVYGALDDFLGTALHYATDSMIDTTGADKCKNAIFAVMATMAVAFPIISYLGLMLLARIAITFVRAVFGYMYAIVGITFLLTMAPIFVPFYLFKPTRTFFEKWVGYLASFALQVILLFAFLAFILSIPASSMVSNLTDIIVYKAETAETTSFRFPWEYCTLCDFKIVDRTSGAELTTKSPNLVKDGKLQCRATPGEPIKATYAVSPNSRQELSALLVLGTQGILSMLLLAVLVEQLLGVLPGIAQRIASSLGGASWATTIGTMPLPFEKQMDDFGEGLRRGMGAYGDNGEINVTGNGPGSIVQGVKDGISMMVSGKMSTSKSDAPAEKNKTTGGARGMNNPALGGVIRPEGQKDAPKTPAPAPSPTKKP